MVVVRPKARSLSFLSTDRHGRERERIVVAVNGQMVLALSTSKCKEFKSFHNKLGDSKQSRSIHVMPQDRASYLNLLPSV